MTFQDSDRDDHASDSTLTGSTVSIDLLRNRSFTGKTRRFKNYELNKENDVPQLKKYSKALSKTQPTWKVNRKQSLVQWLERECPFKKKKNSSNHSLHSPKKSNRKRLTQLNNDLRISDDSCNKRKHFGQIFNVYQAEVQRHPKTKIHTQKEVKFPFKTTPSGNYRLQPSQVVYESKNLSIIAADPASITLNVTESSKTVETTEKKPEDDNWTTTCLYSATGEGKIPFGSEFSETGESDSGVLLNKGKSSSKTSEVNLAKMGYVTDNCIDWDKFSNLPTKSDLQNLIMHQIKNIINPDIQIKIADKIYNCHRLVLQCYCTYFTNKTGHQIELPVNSVGKEAFQSIYQWMLFQCADSFRLLQRDTILDLFKAAQFLGIKELENQCWAFIDNVDMFSEDKAFLLYLEARKIGNKDIMEMMVPRIQRFFLTLVSSKEFVELSFEEVCTFLRSNYICIHCEMEVFLSAIRWLSYDWPRRQQHVAAVMSCIRFGLMDAISLISLKRNPQSPEYQHIATVPEVAQMIEDGMAYTLLNCNETKQPGTFENLKVPKPAPRNWAGIDKKYSTYQDFLNNLAYYRSKHRLEIKQSQLQIEMEKVEDDDFISTAVLLPTTEQKIKKIHSGQSNLHKFVQLEQRELNFLKKLFRHEEKIPKDNKSKQLKSKLYPTADEYLDISKPCPPCSPKPHNLQNAKIVSQKEEELAARKIQSAYRGYSNRKIRAGADKGHSSGLLTRSRSDPSLPLRLLESTAQPQNQKPHKAEEAMIKPGKETVYIFGGSDPFNPDSDSSIGQMVHYYERGHNRWRRCAEMPEPVHYHSVVYFHGMVYVAGGKNTVRHPKDSGAISRKVWRYDPKYRGWSRLKDMPHARRSFNLVAMNKQLYAIGGRNEKEKNVAYVDMYNLETGRWSAVKSLTIPRSGGAACEHQGLIWVAGGFVNDTPTNTVERYNPKLNEWEMFTHLRYTLTYGVMVDVEGKMYIVGGALGLQQNNSLGSGRQIDVWDEKESQWCLATMMSRPRHGHAAVYLKPERDKNPGLVFILGGVMSKHSAVTADVECWQEEDDSWLVDVAHLPHPVSGLAAVIMPTGTMG